jgi:hypothetical protein
MIPSSKSDVIVANWPPFDQDVILPRFRIWRVASPHTIGASVTIEDECSHRCCPLFTLARCATASLLQELDGLLQEPIGILELRAVPAFSVAPNASIYGAVYGAPAPD